jgi:hypothetical protein
MNSQDVGLVFNPFFRYAYWRLHHDTVEPVFAHKAGYPFCARDQLPFPLTIAQLPAALNLPQAALTDDGANKELIVVGGYDSIAYGFRFFRYAPGSI